jgi:hypothetical protein
MKGTKIFYINQIYILIYCLLSLGIFEHSSNNLIIFGFNKIIYRWIFKICLAFTSFFDTSIISYFKNKINT